MNAKQRIGIGAMVLVIIALLVSLNYCLSLLNVADDASVMFGTISGILLLIFGPSILIWLWKWTFKTNKTPKIGE